MASYESPFTVDVRHQDGCAFILLAGELDMATGPVLTQSIDEILHPRPQAVTVDLTELTFVDIAGLRALLAAKHTVTSADARFRLLSVSDLTRRVIQIVRFDGLEEALETV
jgi:anti-sigma B factor antagonist